MTILMTLTPTNKHTIHTQKYKHKHKNTDISKPTKDNRSHTGKIFPRNMSFELHVKMHTNTPDIHTHINTHNIHYTHTNRLELCV